MRDNPSGSVGESLMLFLAGAAIGGLLVALNTPKSGPELREDLRGWGRQARRKASDLAEDVEGAWDRLKREAGEKVVEPMQQEAGKFTG